MIAFDNGPPNGDYVRYIDELLKRSATAASAGIIANAQPMSSTRPSWSPTAPAVSRRAAQGASGTTGFAAPVAATPTAAAAAAIASALMSGQVGGRATLATHTKVGLIVIAIGIVAIAAGFLWQPLNVIVIVAGAALIAWAVRMMRDASTRSP